MRAAPAPPRLARALLRRAVPDDAGPAVEGDLHELYVARRAASGDAAAALWYWLETLSLTMRFMLDAVARSLRGLLGGDAAPSGLDLKLGARLLAKSPGLALVGGLGMAVAVALGTGAFASVNSYLYPELPLSEGDRVVALGKFDLRREYKDERVLHDFLVWRRELRSVVDVGAFRTLTRNIVTPAGEGEPITLAEMTAGFRVARVPAFRGRALVDDDERPGAPPVMVIGYDVWQSRFQGDPAILGREIRVGRTTHTIVGVMPPGFSFPINHQYWVPLRIDPGATIAPGIGPTLDVFARLAPGATKASAQAELGALGRRLAAEGPAELAHLESRVIPYVDIMMNGEADAGQARAGPVRAPLQVAGRGSALLLGGGPGGEEPGAARGAVRIASVSKPIASAAVMKLVEEGKLRLDDRVAPLIAHLTPAPGATVDPRWERMTIRHLLTHTGGWDRTRPNGGFDLEAMDASGAWVSSAIDLLRFVGGVDGRAHRPDILGPALVAEMTGSGPTACPGGACYYAFGWWVRPTQGDPTWTHGGSLPGTTSMLVRSYHDLSWVGLFNARSLAAGSGPELDAALWRALAGVTSFPSHDLFPTC